MKRNVLVVVVAVMLLSVTGAWAQDSIIDNVMKACETEINTYCSQVTLGEGRLLACFYACSPAFTPTRTRFRGAASTPSTKAPRSSSSLPSRSPTSRRSATTT
jgi:hypothetical protein